MLKWLFLGVLLVFMLFDAIIIEVEMIEMQDIGQLLVPQFLMQTTLAHYS